MGGDKIVEFSMLEKVKFYGKEEENEFSKCTPKQWSQRGDTVVQDAQAGSEPPRKGCADIGSQVTEALSWAICQEPDPISSQLPVLSLGGLSFLQPQAIWAPTVPEKWISTHCVQHQLKLG